MRRRRKTCRCCRELFLPRPQTYRQQIVCTKPACAAWRKRRAQKTWWTNNPLYSLSRQAKQKAWRRDHPGYGRAWRQKHPGYVERNRRAQKRRDGRKRAFLAKQNAWNRVHSEKARQTMRLCDLAKQNAWPGFVDGLWRLMVLAKQNAMATPRSALSKSAP